MIIRKGLPRMTDYLAGRQTVGLGTDHAELNAKLDALARYFGLDWLKAVGPNPLQILWKSRDALATNELLNFGDAVENFERVDAGWLEGQVSTIKRGDEGNRAGAVFELLGLNLFLSAGNKVVPSSNSNPGYDGVVELPDQSVLLVSIKNHGMTSHERFFHNNAKELDDQFTGWLRRHAASGTELRILCPGRLDRTEWGKLRQDVMGILDGQLDGTAKNLKTRSDCTIVLKHIDAEYHPLSTTQISSVVFISARAHKNEQDKFIEDLRKGCANLVKHTKTQPESACPVLFVRLCANASTSNCEKWARDYFEQFPNERVGLIVLYQAAIVTSGNSSSITHYLLPILGPQFDAWAHPSGKPERRLPNMAVLIGVVSREASRKVIQTDGRQIPLDDAYTYQRGDIYRFYRFDGSGLEAHLSNPAPRIKIHAEIGDDSGSVVLQGILPETGELLLLP
jgi:hypothetical protein